jgi:pyruvate dehydrogenase E2 component (dihydrolipoamide acetyltransferase)/2-oxoisovalerate dehydrogenase E2 component (dihydrolipoyl transacylase)
MSQPRPRAAIRGLREITMDFQVPELGEGVYEAELVSWLVKPGDVVKRGQALMEVMTDKATMEVPSRTAGRIAELRAEPGQQIKVGQVVLSFEEAKEAHGQGDSENKRVKDNDTEGNGKPRQRQDKRIAEPLARTSQSVALRAAPSVRQMARKLGVDLDGVRGSGPEGRILIGDLTHLIQAAPSTKQQAKAEPKVDYGKPGTRIKLIGLRRKIAEHMALSKRTIPHYSYMDECDVTELVRVRESLKEAYARAGVKLTYLAFIVRAAVGALKDIPLVNSWMEEDKGEIVLHDRYDIGIAVATPHGLIVPVVRGADKKNLGEIASEIERLSRDARAGKTKLEDLRGSTFTITSVGNIGGLISTPVINHPEVGILGIGKIVKRPVYDASMNIHPADILYLSLSFDHRVVDGAVGAVFGNALCRRLTNPLPLVLPEKLA